MLVQSAQVTGFRNIRSAHLEFDPSLNFFFGLNGQGKTSLLEAISYLGELSSFRTSRAEDLIADGETRSRIQCELTQDGLKSSISVDLTTQDGKVRKEAVLNGKKIHSTSHFLKSRFGPIAAGFHAIAFNPSDHELIQGDPANRRSYLDRIIASENPEYIAVVSRYKKSLENRNRLLKDEVFSPRALEAFTEVLVESGAEVALYRLHWLSKAVRVLPQYGEKIAGSAGFFEARYETNWAVDVTEITKEFGEMGYDLFSGQGYIERLQFLKNRLNDGLKQKAHVERQAGMTLIGPHRDDWSLLFRGTRLKSHGSQGEMRSALLALKLTEIELFQSASHQEPVLLLDDFSSELDRNRRESLLQFLKETPLQVFVTATEMPEAMVRGRVFRVHEGRFEMESGG